MRGARRPSAAGGYCVQIRLLRQLVSASIGPYLGTALSGAFGCFPGGNVGCLGAGDQVRPVEVFNPSGESAGCSIIVITHEWPNRAMTATPSTTGGIAICAGRDAAIDADDEDFRGALVGRMHHLALHARDRPGTIPDPLTATRARRVML
jgi:hypothetical protein